MTDVPPDNGAPGAAPAEPSEAPVVRRSNFAPPPPGTEPPTFDDDALAEAMAAEVRSYTVPITLPRLPTVPPVWGSEISPPPSGPPSPAAPFVPSPVAPQDVPAPVVPPAAPEQASAAAPSQWSDENGPGEEELRRALGGGSTLETIERLETELKHLSNGEPTILPVTSTPAEGVPLGVAPDAAAPALAPAEAPPVAAEPSPVAGPPSIIADRRAGAETPPASTADVWPFPPPVPAQARPAPDQSEPGRFFPASVESVGPAAASPPAVDVPVEPQPPVVEPVSPADSATTAAPALPTAEDPVSVVPAAPGTDQVLPDPDVDPLAWLAPRKAAEPFAAGAAPAPAPEPAQALEPPLATQLAPAPEQLAPAPEPTPNPPPAFAPQRPDPDSYAPYPFEIDLSLIDPVAAAAVAAAANGGAAAEVDAPAVEEPPIAATDPDRELPGGAAPAPVAPASSWGPADPSAGAWEVPAPPVDAPSVAPAAAFPVPYSTEPPVGPEAPDWLDAPPPVFHAPELVEPPAFVDSSPNPALDPVSPITANTMAALPTPLPTDQPNIADRAELPPPPGYEDIPIMSSDAASPPTPVAPSAFFPPSLPPVAPPGAPLLPVPGGPTPAGAAPVGTPSMEAPTTSSPFALDHDDDDVIDEVDRVTGADATPVSSILAEPLAPPSAPMQVLRLSEGQPALVDENAEPPAFEVEIAGPEPTPLDMRAGRAARLFWLWFAANSSVLSMGLGAVLLATGMSLRQSIVSALAGVAISFLPLGLGTLAGKWSGQPTMIVSRAAFGHAGNILPTLLAVLTRVLWGGVLLWLLATAVAQVLVGAGLDAGLGTTVWQLVGLVAGFVIATVIAVFGYGFVAKLQLVVSIAGGLLILGSAALTYQHLDFAKALTLPDGNWILVVSGAALVFSVVGLAWVHSSSDLARYQRPGSSGATSMLWATFGATLPPFLLIVWGSMLAASDPVLARQLRSNPLAAIASLLPAWYPAPLLVAAALGLLSGAVLTMYSGSFALQALGLKVRRSIGTLVAAVLLLATAAILIFVVTDFSSLVRDLVITVAVPVAAWAGIFASEMMIRTRRFHTPSLLAPGGIYPQLRVLNFVAMIVISAIGLGLVSSSIPGLEWEGFLYRVAGIGHKSVLANSDAGVFVALLLGVLVPLAGGIPSIRRQERSSVVTEPAQSRFAPPLLD